MRPEQRFQGCWGGALGCIGAQCARGGAPYYENALEFLADDYTSKGEDLPEGIENPMGTDDEHRVSIRKRMPSMEHASARGLNKQGGEGSRLRAGSMVSSNV